MRSVAVACVGFSLILVSSALFGCGGSSGDDDEFVGAATLAVAATPTEIDTGDHMKVEIEINEVHPDGITLKVRYPQALSYVTETSVLRIDDKKNLNIGPQYLTNANSNDSTYLVYLLDASVFEGADSATLTFELRGDDPTSSNNDDDEFLLAVDADLLVEAFDPENPEFSAEDSVVIAVNPET